MKIVHTLIAGLFGGLTNSIGIWLCGFLGITTALGFNFTPELTMKWLLPRLVPSALWGLLFLLPFWEKTIFRKGIVLSLLPAVFMLFMVFPKMGAGMLGLMWGNTAPLFALFFTVIWGLTAASWLKLFKQDKNADLVRVGVSQVSLK